MWGKLESTSYHNFLFKIVFKSLLDLLQGRKKSGLCDDVLRYQDPNDWPFYRLILDISVVPKETNHAISDSIETVSPVKSE